MNSISFDRDKNIEEVRPVIPIIYESLEIGTQEARSYFEKKKEKIEPYLASDLVRYEAKKILKNHGIEAEEYKQNLGIKDIPLNGLFLEFCNYNIRILKAQDAQLPTTGHSKARQDFYQQNLPFNKSDWSEIIQQKINLIFLWWTDAHYQIGKDIKLVCPKSGGNNKNSLEWYWQSTIDPIEMLIIPMENNYESPEDLDIASKKIDKKREEQHGNN